jgi:hypothetical protein
VLAINELIDLAKKRWDKCFFLKVDFEKAYDSVSWSYLEYMLRRMNFEFEDKWISWMSTCFRSNSISVIIVIYCARSANARLKAAIIFSLVSDCDFGLDGSLSLDGS